MTDTIDFACNLEAFSNADRAEYESLTRELYEAASNIERSGNGVTLALDGGASALILAARWATLESQCCPFWRFELTFEHASTTLALHGPDGAGELIESVAEGFAS